MFSMMRPISTSTLFPYTTLFRSHALPLSRARAPRRRDRRRTARALARALQGRGAGGGGCTVRDDLVTGAHARSEEHTSELQSHSDLVCRLLLEKKKS